MTDKNTFLKTIAGYFTHHHHSVNETYVQHLLFASWCGLRLLFAGAACCIHSVFPFLFIQTASKTLEKVQQDMMERRMRPQPEHDRTH